MNEIKRLYQSVCDAIKSHVVAFWPDRRIETFIWAIGPIARSIRDFRVLRIAPEKLGETWTYLSCGAWQVSNSPSDRFEFVLLSPIESPAHVETLAMLAHFHSDKDGGIRPGYILDIGRPWMDGATCDHFLVSLPYPLGPRFERMMVPDSKISIRILWLVPITADEAQFARESGVEALEEKFEDAGIDYLDPRRRSVLELRPASR